MTPKVAKLANSTGKSNIKRLISNINKIYTNLGFTDMSDYNFSTGLKGLDTALKGLRTGDNVVWQVDSVEDYIPFVRPYCDYNIKNGIDTIYIRFARHKPLLQKEDATAVYELNAALGFEDFITKIHAIIAKHGLGCCYLFDCLSDLAADWYSDRMLGNFFSLTCPYLYRMDPIAYFAILRNRHSFHATSPIVSVTQLFLDIYNHQEQLYVHPIKVAGRYSSTMNTLHLWQADEFPAVRTSGPTTEILTEKPWSRLDSASLMNGYWSRTFAQAEQAQADYSAGRIDKIQAEQWRDRLLRMVVSREPKVLEMAKKYLTLEDVLAIRRRMVGTGLIGGKSDGMLLARAILRQADEKWNKLLEPHDSFYIGSDVFYTFLVQNDIWWYRQQQRDKEGFLKDIDQARQQILTGEFPDYIIKQFIDVLDYFGQWPIIVRSSSLMEDHFGNIFAGKYDSVFCVNQGDRQQRLDEFIDAIRHIYASTMSKEALTYRAQRGLLDKDEQMALLIQRVSGVNYGSLFFPQAAGVGFSFNPYVWDEQVDPEAGMLRLVFGLGTRAVNRADDDYTRIVALNIPQKKPTADLEGNGHTQRKVDALDMQRSSFESFSFEDIAGQCPGLPLDMFAEKDTELLRRARQHNVRDIFAWTLTFSKLLGETDFAANMREMMKILEQAYGSTVDIEFTLNFFNDAEKGDYNISLVQCRPLEIKGAASLGESVEDVADENLILKSAGPVIGQSRAESIDRIVYVSPKKYGYLSERDRHSIARLIGRITHEDSSTGKTIMLLGPGRWGTSTASLGIPVTFAEINTASIICEIVAMREDFVPDVSLGTHFFSDLIEFEILYMALYPGRQGHRLNEEFFDRAKNHLAEICPDQSQWADTVFVLDGKDPIFDGSIRLYADTKNQKVLSYISDK